MDELDIILDAASYILTNIGHPKSIRKLITSCSALWIK